MAKSKDLTQGARVTVSQSCPFEHLRGKDGVITARVRRGSRVFSVDFGALGALVDCRFLTVIETTK